MAMEMETCKLNFDKWALFQKKELKKIEIIEIRKIIRNNWNCTLCNWYCCQVTWQTLSFKVTGRERRYRSRSGKYLAQGCLQV